MTTKDKLDLLRALVPHIRLEYPGGGFRLIGPQVEADGSIYMFLDWLKAGYKPATVCFELLESEIEPLTNRELIEHCIGKLEVAKKEITPLMGIPLYGTEIAK